MSKQLSVITINLNNRLGLIRTIQSVINQTYAYYEYIVIDGASTDGSIETIKEFHTKINLWISESDTGVYSAMNKGIDRATGKYCLFLNSGDEFKDEKSLADLIGCVNDEDIVFGNIESGEKVVTFPDSLTFYNLRWGSLPHPASIIKRTLFNLYGRYNEKNKVASDWEFWIKTIILNNCSYKHINRVISIVESPGLSSSSDLSEGYSILYSLVPKRIVDDYDKFKELEESSVVEPWLWAEHNIFIKYILKFLFWFKREYKT